MESLALLLLPSSVGFLSGYLTRGSIRDEWYSTLKKPSWQPPGSLIGGVWIVLYLLMGVTLQRIGRAPNNGRALMAFGVQLALNFSWSLIFFRGQRPDWALVNIAALALSIVVMMYYIRQLDPFAANLQIPYLLWVLFAATLNASIVSLNAAS